MGTKSDKEKSRFCSVYRRRCGGSVAWAEDDFRSINGQISISSLNA